MLALSKMKSLKYLVMVIFLSAVKGDSEDICTINELEQASENARSSNDIKLQFVASYGHNSKTRWVHECTASVLTKRTLLTAAHCLRKFDQEKNIVTVGANDLNSEDWSSHRQEMSISHVISHPDYDDITAYFDVAIIHTVDDIEFDNESGVKPACLSNETFKTTDFLRNENRETYLAAWGGKTKTEPSEISMSSLNLFPEESCDTKYDISGKSKVAKNREKFLPNRFNSTVICAGSTVYDVGSCKGDSGGPLIEVINKDGQSKALIRGVVYGCIGACCSKEYPTIFANMADKKIWNFIMKEGLNPTTIYVDKESDLICEKNKKKFNFKIDKFGNKLCLQVSKKQALIGGLVGAFVSVVIVGTLIYCGFRRCVNCFRRCVNGNERRDEITANNEEYPMASPSSPGTRVNTTTTNYYCCS